METTQDKDQVLGDYAAFLRALLPQAIGFHCFGRDGSPIWSDTPDAKPPADPAHASALRKVLGSEGKVGLPVRLPLGSVIAYVVPLASDRDETLGALTIIVDRATGAMSCEFCMDLLRPALRTLQRELTLRFRLLDGYRKLNVQAAEERLLHEVETVVHEREECSRILGRILRRCRRHLPVDFAALHIPDKNISLAEGEGLTRHEIALLFDELAATGQPAARDGVWRGEDRYAVVIRQDGRRRSGLLVLSGWGRSEFSLRRRARVARYIVSHIEYVLDRDYDGLTGLMSWPVFEARLIDLCRGGTRDGAHTVICFDIDQLHVVNETLGRDTGDEILADFAALVRELLPGHAVTRITSDSFAALLADTGLPAAEALASEVCRRFRTLEYVRGGQTYRPTVSIGIGPLTGEPETASGALATAQVACQAAKDRGRGRVEVYQDADLSIVQRLDDLQLVGYVRNAIDRSRLALVAQPIVPTRPGPARHYYEVLVRLLDDDNQHVSPGDFLSAAERYQLMEELDRWVVNQTLKVLAPRARELAAAGARFAINLSGQSLGSAPFLDFCQEKIQGSGVPPAMLCFEITETVAVANMQHAQNLMHALRRLGCRFSLDDFGTGLSSFAYLKLFPVDTLKIDGSFIRDLATNAVSQSVVAAISEVARVMQLETVAEYVQDQEALDLLGRLGVTWVQGYLLGAPGILSDKLEFVLSHPAGNTLATAITESLRVRNAAAG